MTTTCLDVAAGLRHAGLVKPVQFFLLRQEILLLLTCLSAWSQISKDDKYENRARREILLTNLLLQVQDLHPCRWHNLRFSLINNLYSAPRSWSMKSNFLPHQRTRINIQQIQHLAHRSVVASSLSDSTSFQYLAWNLQSISTYFNHDCSLEIFAEKCQICRW